LPFRLTPFSAREELLRATMNLSAQINQHKNEWKQDFFRRNISHQRAPLSIPATNHSIFGSELKSGVTDTVAVRSSSAFSG
jgi:hypothetical protein